MTLPASGGITGANIRDELRQSGGNLVFPDATTRWLSEKPSGNLVLPTDFYSKQAVKLVDSKSFGGGSSFSTTINLGPDYPGRSILCIAAAFRNGVGYDMHINLFQINSSSLEVLDGRFGFTGAGTPVSMALGVGGSTASGTSATLGIGFANTVSAAYVAVYAIASRGSNSPSANGTVGTSSSASVNANVPTDNAYFVVTGLKQNVPGGDMAVNGADEKVDADLGGGIRWCIGISNRLPTQVGRSGGFTTSGPPDFCLLSVVGFG